MAMFLSVKPQFNAHLIATEPDGTVTRIEDLTVSDVRINGGFFVFKREILDWIEPGDELVDETFARLIPKGEVIAYRHDGFWRPMDTIKDRQSLEALHESGDPPWLVAGPSASSHPGLMLSLSFTGTGEPLRAFSPSAATPTTSRSAAGRRSSRSPAAVPDLEVHWVVLAASGDREREARASADAFLAAVGSARSRCTASATPTSRTPAPR